jgi:hypothetical protein
MRNLSGRRMSEVIKGEERKLEEEIKKGPT